MLTDNKITRFENAMDLVSGITGLSIEEVAYIILNQNMDLVVSKGKLDVQEIAELYSEMQLADDLKQSTNE